MSKSEAGSDPRVGLWRDMLRETLASLRSTNIAIKWLYHEEIVQRSGHALADGCYSIIEAAIGAFEKDPDFRVYQHTLNRYAGEVAEDRYFVIQRRVLPPGIDIG